MIKSRHRNRSRRTARRVSTALLIGAVAILLVAAPATAKSNNPTSAQYHNQVSQVGGQVGGGGSSGDGSGKSPGSASTVLQKKVVGDLPFTGLDLMALAAVAIALTSMGIALRRMTATRGSRTT